MAINFPVSLDNFTNPVSTDTTTAVDHAVQHSNVNDAVEALEAKVGVNSSAVTTSHDYKLSDITGSNKALGTLTVGATTVTSGTNTKVLYNSSGVLGQYTVSGSGNVAMTTSPIFTTPTLGDASATTIDIGNIDTTISRLFAGQIGVEGVAVPTISSTNTLTNKRVSPRTGTTTSSATPTINTDNYDYYAITAQSGNITSMTTNLSGTPTTGQTLWLEMTATSGTPTITWGTGWEASSIALPTGLTTTRQDFKFVWNSVTSKWRFVGYA
mgnify:FL=1